jgi:glutamate decarboxylase
MGANAQVALEKFARYFEVESRILPVSSKSQFRLDPELVRENIDDNTIGIYVILGSTMTGHYEPVEEISNILDEYQAKTGIDIPIHVDAASGGFIAPFTHCGAGGARWNFELPRVKSINTSGHKYGLVSAGVGWVIWRDESYLPESLVFTLDYLGGQEKSYTLNFSRPGAQVIVQYYNLIHLGFAGYREIMENCLRNARLLANSLERTPWFTVVSDIHRRVPEAPSVKKSDKEGATNTEGNETNNGYVLAAENGSPADTLSSLVDNLKTKATETTNTVTSKFPDSISDDTSANYTPGLPIVAFRLADSFKKDYPHIQQSTIIFMLRVKHWIIPNYKLPPNEQETEIMRVVVRENMTYDIMDRLLSDLHDVMETLMQRDEVDLSMLQNKKKKKKEMQKKGKDGGGKSKVEKFEERVEEADRRIDENLHKTVC